MKQYFMVIGADFNFTGLEFRRVCFNRIKQIEVYNRKKEDISFSVFDFEKGEISTREITYPSGKKTIKTTKPTPSNPSLFKPITKKNYIKKDKGSYRFKDGQTDIMSILDVYKAVQELGKDMPESLYQLNFFSHGFKGGPVLVNSYDDAIFNRSMISHALRDPDDMDPRMKDFDASNMDINRLSYFQKSFNPSGFVWNWGCTFDHTDHLILTKLERSPNYKDRGLGDEDILKLRNIGPFEYLTLKGFLYPYLGADPFPDTRNVEIKFKFIKAYFCNSISGSYNHFISKNAKVKTFGALTGTYSDFDTNRFGLMYVPGPRRHLRFFKNYLGFEFDPLGRGYGEYKPDYACIPPTAP